MAEKRDVRIVWKRPRYPNGTVGADPQKSRGQEQ